LLGHEHAVRFHTAPVRNRDGQPTFHASEASLQILQLNCKRRFENPLENLFMTKLQSLLDGRVRI